MIIDPTTRNSVFNPVGIQGQWYQHRWGQRDYPQISLSSDQLRISLDNNNEGFINVPLMYGDVADYEHFDILSKHGKDKLNLNSYGMFSNDYVTLILSNYNQVTIHVDGWGETLGKVFLGTDYTKIKKVAETIPHLNLVYHCYQHNIQSLAECYQFCIHHNITLHLQSGEVHNGNNSHPIITKEKQWLYDVHGFTVDKDKCSDLEKYISEMSVQKGYKLRKSLYSYNTLRTYMKVPEGRRITESALVPRIFPDKELEIHFKNSLFQIDCQAVTPTGHVFTSHNMMSTFMQFLGKDWGFDVRRLNSYDEFMLRLLFSAQEIQRYDIDKHTIENVFKNQSE